MLTTILLPRVHADAAAGFASVTPPNTARSLLSEARDQRAAAAQQAQVAAWSDELQQGLVAYQQQQAAEAAAQAEAARIAALNDHPPPPADIQAIIVAAFSPLGQDAVVWAERVAYCESRYHPNSVNSSSGAAGLFQFMPGTWAGSPWANQSPFDPVANAQAAAWLYARSGPGRWSCQ